MSMPMLTPIPAPVPSPRRVCPSARAHVPAVRCPTRAQFAAARGAFAKQRAGMGCRVRWDANGAGAGAIRPLVRRFWGVRGGGEMKSAAASDLVALKALPNEAYDGPTFTHAIGAGAANVEKRRRSVVTGD